MRGFESYMKKRTAWGDATRGYPLAKFFINKLEEASFMDVEPIKLVPTYRNMRVGEERLTKRIDQFLVSTSLMSDHNRITAWIKIGGESNHFPVFLHMEREECKPPSPFKFNYGWLENEDFVKLVKA